eukprot:3472390-Pleurochrysis_carterae.AAC.1
MIRQPAAGSKWTFAIDLNIHRMLSSRAQESGVESASRWQGMDRALRSCGIARAHRNEKLTQGYIVQARGTITAKAIDSAQADEHIDEMREIS